jgi:hypothetical protein
MTVLLRWLEPVEPGRTRRRARPWDWIISFGIAAIFGLGVAEQSGPTMSVALGNQSELSLPAHAWQYGLGLLVLIAGGSLGLWIASSAGRAEVTMRADGIGWLLGRGFWSFYPYHQIERCELQRVTEGDFWRLTVTMRPQNPGGPAPVNLVTIPKRVDLTRVREILQTAGVVTTGWPAS